MSTESETPCELTDWLLSSILVLVTIGNTPAFFAVPLFEA